MLSPLIAACGMHVRAEERVSSRISPDGHEPIISPPRRLGAEWWRGGRLELLGIWLGGTVDDAGAAAGVGGRHVGVCITTTQRQTEPLGTSEGAVDDAAPDRAAGDFGRVWTTRTCSCTVTTSVMCSHTCSSCCSGCWSWAQCPASWPGACCTSTQRCCQESCLACCGTGAVEPCCLAGCNEHRGKLLRCREGCGHFPHTCALCAVVQPCSLWQIGRVQHGALALSLWGSHAQHGATAGAQVEEDYKGNGQVQA